MTLNDAQATMTRTARLQLTLLLFASSAFFFYPRPAQAIDNPRGALFHFRDAFRSAPAMEESPLRQVRVEHVFDLPVIQQPADEPYYVSNREGEATEFSMVSAYGSIGLLAHNTLSGRHFSELHPGQEVQLLYMDGTVRYFEVKKILRFQALQPNSVSSSFRSLETQEILSASEVFTRAYVGGERLVFQTCIAAERNVSWGRLFIIAMPME